MPAKRTTNQNLLEGNEDNLWEMSDEEWEDVKKKPPTQRQKGITKQELLDGCDLPPGENNPRCQKCKLWTKSYAPFVKPSVKGRYVLVLGSPTSDDKETMGEGVEWYMLKYIVNAVGIETGNCTYTAATLCAPASGIPGKTAREMCRPFVLEALNDLTDPVFICFGAVAGKQFFSELLSFDDMVGRVKSFPHGKVMVTYSPREYFHEVRERELAVGIHQAIVMHLKRLIHVPSWYDSLPDYRMEVLP